MVALVVIEAMRSMRRQWPGGGQEAISMIPPKDRAIGARSRTERLTAWGQEPENVVGIFMPSIVQDHN